MWRLLQQVTQHAAPSTSDSTPGVETPSHEQIHSVRLHVTETISKRFSSVRLPVFLSVCLSASQSPGRGDVLPL